MPRINEQKLKDIFFWIIILLALILISYNMVFSYITTKEIKSKEGQCWVWIVDRDTGEGFGDIINHCYQTRINCEKLYSCDWIITDTVEGCKCFTPPCKLWEITFRNFFNETNNTYWYTPEALKSITDQDVKNDIKNIKCID